MLSGKTPIALIQNVAIFARKFLSTAANVQPFENIPGPPGNGLPFLGHANHLFKKPEGFKKSWVNINRMKEKYLKDHDKLIRLNLPPINPKHGGKCLILLDPNDVEKVHRNEGKYPTR